MAAGYLVEGRMEQRIIQRLCKGAPVRTIETNGKDVAIAALAKRLAPLIRLLRNCHPVIIIFDREGRVDTAAALRASLLRELANNDVQVGGLLIGIPDRMIENWILACGRFREEHGLEGGVDGQNGKVRIKEILRRAKEPYGETTTGVDLFCNIDVASAVNNSPSFEEFVAATKDHCSWLRKAFYN